MKQDQMSGKGILETIEKVHDAAFEEVKRLEQALTGIRFEGKSSFGHNLRRLRSVLRFLGSELTGHMELEEQVLFPFLASHVPKLESVIHILQAEHKDLRENLDDFEFFLGAVSDSRPGVKQARPVQKLLETGTYLAYLLKNHARAENQSVYQVAKRTLKPMEKEELARRIANYAAGLKEGLKERHKRKATKSKT